MTPETPLRVCGHMGPSTGDRSRAMARLMGDAPRLLDAPNGALYGSNTVVAWTGQRGASWASTPLPSDVTGDAATLATSHDATSFWLDDDGSVVLRGSVSGAAPLYVDVVDGVHVSTSLDALIRTRSAPVRPDWDAWAHIVAAGGPLENRTTVEGIHRVAPWERVTVTPDGAVYVDTSDWPWLDLAENETSITDVEDALSARISDLAAQTPFISLLSGGWDSRLLATFGTGARPDDITAWTTSSDIGHALEELVATQVARTLTVPHTIVPPRWDQFRHDFERCANAVEHQTSLHSWLAPVLPAVASQGGTVLDGLGGGIFLGGDFPDDESNRPVVDKRFNRLAHYLTDARVALTDAAADQVRNRTRTGFERVAAPLVDHPFASAFTAYLTRSLPAISRAPHGLVAEVSHVATPFSTHDVVRAALGIPASQHAGGRLYRELMETVSPDLARLPTASQLAPPVRQHRRRVASADAAEYLRGVIMSGPVSTLVSPKLADAPTETWRANLNRTKPQHLLRGLALLALWLDTYAEFIKNPDPSVLTEGGA